MRYVVVMPYVLESFRDRCLARCKFDNLVLVDNTKSNLGVMMSHDIGIDVMREQDSDWLLIMSAAVRFGDKGGLDFVGELENRAGHAVVRCEGLYGWHLMAFARETIELAGRWDCNFTPYGLDDNDMAIRIHKSRPGATWSGITADVFDTTMGHSLKLGGVKSPHAPLLAYFKSKWGFGPGAPFDDYHDHPFDDPERDVRYWPPANGGQWDQPAPFTSQAYFR